MSIFKLFFGRRNEQCAKYQISFNSADTDYGTHGYIIARNKKVGINAFLQVRFVFKGMTTPPPLTEEVISELFRSARNLGYEVHSLKTYGLKVATTQPAKLSSVLSISRLAAENGRIKLPTQEGVRDGTIA